MLGKRQVGFPLTIEGRRNPRRQRHGTLEIVRQTPAGWRRDSCERTCEGTRTRRCRISAASAIKPTSTDWCTARAADRQRLRCRRVQLCEQRRCLLDPRGLSQFNGTWNPSTAKVTPTPLVDLLQREELSVSAPHPQSRWPPQIRQAVGSKRPVFPSCAAQMCRAGTFRCVVAPCSGGDSGRHRDLWPAETARERPARQFPDGASSDHDWSP
jgi:hypothetical protein